MKAAIVIVLFAFFRSCNSPTSNVTTDFSIQTEKTSYTVSDKFTPNVTFHNALGSDVIIYNAGCGFPQFTLEKFENKNWITAGGPVCVALLVAPTKLESGKTFETKIRFYIENNISSGIYRMKFIIRQNDGVHSIDSIYLYSNSFQLIKN